MSEKLHNPAGINKEHGKKKPEAWSKGSEEDLRHDEVLAIAGDKDRTDAANARDAAQIIDKIHASEDPYTALDEARIKHSEAGLSRYQREEGRDYPQNSDHPGLTYDGRNGYGHKATLTAEDVLNVVDNELHNKDMGERYHPSAEWKSKLAEGRREAAEKSDSLAERKEAWAKVLLEHPIAEEVVESYKDSPLELSPDGLVKMEDDIEKREEAIAEWQYEMEKADKIYDGGDKDTSRWISLARYYAQQSGSEAARTQYHYMEEALADKDGMVHTSPTTTGSINIKSPAVRSHAMSAIQASEIMPREEAIEMRQAVLASVEAGRTPTYQELTDFFNQGRMVRRNPSWKQAPEEKAAA